MARTGPPAPALLADGRSIADVSDLQGLMGSERIGVPLSLRVVRGEREP